MLVFSENSLKSGWVEDEVNRAFEEERRRNHKILLPIMVDDSVMNASQPWAIKIRVQYNIGDFRKWRTDDDYDRSFLRLMSNIRKSLRS